MNLRNLSATCALVALAAWTAASTVFSAAPPIADTRAAMSKQFQAGNYKVAFEGYEKLVLDPKNDPAQLGQDLTMALQCLAALGRVDEQDDLREKVIGVQKAQWRALWAVAETYANTEHYGYIVAGKYYRGHRRGGDGKYVNSFERDRIRALQLMDEARIKLEEDKQAGETNARTKSDFFMSYARMLLSNQGWGEAWRLQYLSNLKELPDYADGWYGQNQPQGAPVGPDGKPVYYSIPKSYADAKNDGERWRWFLLQALEFSPARQNEIRWQLADFCRSQYGEQTLAEYGNFFARQAEDDTKKNESGVYALHNLGEDETIARLATGIKRFKLPDEFNYIRIYQQIADEPKTGYGQQAVETLADVFENRRQYPKAADYWRRAIKEYGNRDHHKQRLEQIIANWGRFEPISTQPAGQGATIDYRFRNGSKVSFEAHEIKIDKLLADVKSYLRGNPKQVDWNRMNIGNLGYTLVHEKKSEYLGEKVANWSLDLKPRPAHFDARVTVSTPLQKAGAYYVTAKMADGNTTHIVLWVADTAIVKKPMPNQTYYYVGDAQTGAPIAKANVEFFGFRHNYNDPKRPRIDVMNFAEFADAEGQILASVKAQPQDFQWLITARTKEGRLAYLGFTNVWHAEYYDAEYNQVKAFGITDRPVYRPAQTVKFKFWIGTGKYDQPDKSEYAGKDMPVIVSDPQGQQVLQKSYKTDEFGGLEGSYELPSGAPLGVYSIVLPHYGQAATFRVEEYKKPEYEVTVEAPKEPVMLGEKVTAIINARYYFGAPVAHAKVKYKVMRSAANEEWYPIGPWDWCFGRGYWWFACDYNWYPGWGEWGCERPFPWWFPRNQDPPEMVADFEGVIQADGTLPVEIDTALAKAVHPDQDHTYTITAEVVDDSRRTIVGTGKVMVARKPFKVFTWLDRGYYRTGDAILAQMSAHTLDQKPVAGTGVLQLLKIGYEKDPKTGDLKPTETVAQTWEINTDDQGKAKQQIKAAEPGQYRLSYKLTDSKKHTIEGAYVFTIIGPGFDGRSFRFNDIELINDKPEYAPGDKVKLQVNTNQADGTVLLFVRPANGAYLAPKVLRLKGKSTVEEIEVIKKDMPNFFVEAITIHGGKLFNETKEIIVPPEKRVLNVDVSPSAENYKPGEKGTIKLKVTDTEGKPVTGSLVLTMYDEAVEYISGGSNVPEIKEFFWKWRRSHNPQSETSLAKGSGNMDPPGKPGMGNIGVFGNDIIMEEMEISADMDGAVAMRGGRRAAEKSMRAFGGGGGIGAPGAAMPAAAPMEAMALSDSVGSAKGEGGGGPAQAAPNLVQATVRKNFADTAKWVASIATDKDGLAEVPVDMPENLTTWKIRVWGMGAGTRVGQGESQAITRKDLIVRLQSPRFFVQKDEVVLSANVHNYLKAKKSVQVSLELEGKTLAPMGETTSTVNIDAGGEQRVDFRVKVLDEGKAIIRMKALTDVESDALEMTFPVFVHGMLKTDSYSGVVRPDKDSAQVTFNVPKDRRMNDSRLEVRYSPTLAGAMVDALPYMVDYPYGCTEQTLNRFLPTVMTQKILMDMGLDLKAIQAKRTNLNAQEIGDDVERAKGWKRFNRNPVFDQAEVTAMVKDGLKRLTEMQLSDGGWGWFSGYGEHSWPHTTAYVVHGLQLAQQNDVALVPGVLENGVAWLQRYQDQQVQMLKNAPTKTKPWKDRADDLDAFIYMVLVDAKIDNQAMQDYLYRDRTHLAVYTKAMFGLALHKLKVQDKLDMILENISQFVVQDEENQTAYLKLPVENYWWYWYGSEYEAQGYYLKLLSKTDPKGEVASRLVKYLLNNRKHATYWNSTRDTAICVEAMADYLKASGESKPDMTVEVWLDGKKQKDVKITAEDLFTFDNKFVLFGDAVTDGEHKLEIRRQGKGPVYFNAYLTNFTLEDFITKAGLEIKVNRKYYKLTKVDKSIKVAGSSGQAVDQKVEKYERSEVANLATLKSGDLVEIELEVDSKNDYEYILFEDMKASGFEPVDLRSGYNSNSMNAYMELRDERVCFFVRALARGKHSVSYRMRAEIPGKFSALPTRASAMYAPELKANSDELKVSIED